MEIVVVRGLVERELMAAENKSAVSYPWLLEQGYLAFSDKQAVDRQERLDTFATDLFTHWIKVLNEYLVEVGEVKNFDKKLTITDGAETTKLEVKILRGDGPTVIEIDRTVENERKEKQSQDKVRLSVKTPNLDRIDPTQIDSMFIWGEDGKVQHNITFDGRHIDKWTKEQTQPSL